jgi:biotin transport system substrate-specific component
VLLFLAGELCIYAVGVPWLAVSAHLSLSQAFSLGMKPFVWFDLAKAAFAALALPGAWRLVNRTLKK